MLTQLTTRKLDVPGEEGEWIEIRPLSGRRKREAQEAKFAAGLHTTLGTMGALSEADRALLLEAQAAAARVAVGTNAPESVPDPYAEYDQAAVLKSSIVAWSYDAEVTPENIDDLDAPTQDYVFRELIRPLIERKERQKLERFFDLTPA